MSRRLKEFIQSSSEIYFKLYNSIILVYKMNNINYILSCKIQIRSNSIRLSNNHNKINLQEFKLKTYTYITTTIFKIKN